MTHNLVICRFSEQRYMILKLCNFFGTPGNTEKKVDKVVTANLVGLFCDAGYSCRNFYPDKF